MSAEAITVGLSGGVNSAVAALLLQQQGHAVSAVFMKNWDEDDTHGHCAAAEDLADARRVADQLGIPLRAVNFSAEYWEYVFRDFLAEYRAGRTPNPDVLCNQEIKFKAFLHYAVAGGANRIATGHYARQRQAGGEWQLLKGTDPGKDQSYFLYRLDQSQLARSLFPLGDRRKSEVRALAARLGLAVHAKRDSTGICFIGERPFREFLARYIQPAPGPIVTPDGRAIGRHQGLVFYTLGQRRGLGVGGLRGAAEAPWYVVGKEFDGNRLVIAQGHDHPLLFSHRLRAGRLNWIGEPPRAGRCYTARIRYRQSDQACRILAVDEHGVLIGFDQAQRAVTPGQSAVLYDGERCLGGGIIEQSWTDP